MVSQNVTIQAADGGQFSAYLATPDQDLAPGIVLIQEIFGVNEMMRGLAEGYAAAGYFAIVPDLFWRQTPNIQLNYESEADWEKAFELYNGFDVDQGVEDLIATLNYLRALENCIARVGTIGFCLGGQLAYLMATRSDATCNVSYYGVSIDQYLTEAINIKSPTLLHIAEEDRYVSPTAQATIKAGLKNIENVTIYSYPGVNHGFARPGGDDYVEESAGLANRRTIEFLKTHLG